MEICWADEIWFSCLFLWVTFLWPPYHVIWWYQGKEKPGSFRRKFAQKNLIAFFHQLTSLCNKIWFLNGVDGNSFNEQKVSQEFSCKFLVDSVCVCVCVCGVGVKKVHGLEQNFRQFTKDYVLIVFLLLVLSFQKFALSMVIKVPQQTCTCSKSAIETLEDEWNEHEWNSFVINLVTSIIFVV